MERSSNNKIINILEKFAKKFYLNNLIKGLFWFILFSVSLLFVLSTIENLFWLNSTFRLILLILLIISLTTFFSYYIALPVLRYFGLLREKSYKDFALLLGNYSNTDDKILSALELFELNELNKNELLLNELSRRSNELSKINIKNFLNIKEYYKWIIGNISILAIFFTLSFTFPKQFINPLVRISNYNKIFPKDYGFRVNILNTNFYTESGKSFVLNFEITGDKIPKDIYILSNGNQFIPKKTLNNRYEYIFENITENTIFQIIAEDWISDKYEIKVYNKPTIYRLVANIIYPNYTKINNEQFVNIFSYSVPRGTKIMFSFNMKDADSLIIVNGDKLNKYSVKNKLDYQIQILKNESIQIITKSIQSPLQDTTNIYITEIPDAYPQILVQVQKDTFSIMHYYVSGSISDDYGFTKLLAIYKLTRKDSTINGKIPINISNNDLIQNFNFDVDFSFLNLQPDDIIHFYLEIYDNDAIAGPKATKSREYEIKIPTKEEIQIEQSKQLQAANSKFSNIQKELNDIKNELKQLENQWKLERKFNYEQKQKWENLIKKQNDIINELQNLEQNLQLSPSYDENLEIYEKIQQIDELIKSINLDELNEYLENLQKLMENNELKSEDIEEFKSQNEELNKMLDRQIDLLKRLDIEKNLRETFDEFKDLSKQFDELSKKQDLDELTKQNELKQMLEKQFEKYDSLLKENEKLSEPFKMENIESEEQTINNEVQQAEQNLQKNNQKKANENQKNTSQQLNDLANKLEQNLEKQLQEENAEDATALRQLLKNVLLASFEQENLIKNLYMQNPRLSNYQDYVRKQYELQEVMKRTKDSLYMIGKRQPMVSNFIFDEINKIEKESKKAINNLNNWTFGPAAINQQNLMTSLNNLALFLSDVLQQMEQQNSMSQMNSDGAMKCNNPKNTGNSNDSKPSMKTLKQLQQDLNKQMEALQKEMQNGKKQGKEISEALAKMAAQQEAIRRAMQQMKEQMSKEGNLKNASFVQQMIEDMEKTEKDLYNKNLTYETIKRQKQIEIRMLEAEKAEQQQETDNLRKSETAKNDYNSNLIKNFQYNVIKNNNFESMNRNNLNFNLYYRKKIQEYFNNVNYEKN
ncbi:MAG TPA: hypothetical protein PLM94_02085 [Bacteroidales bacterium]|mgnify:FL=1|nr:hypothetical protein [Bacteroidales bacterium]